MIDAIQCIAIAICIAIAVRARREARRAEQRCWALEQRSWAWADRITRLESDTDRPRRLRIIHREMERRAEG